VIDVHGLPLAYTDDGSRRNTFDLRGDYASNNDQRDLALRGSSRGDRFTVSAGYAWREGDDVEAPDSATAFESGNSSDPAFTGTLPFTDFEQQNGQVALGWRSERATSSLRLSTWNTEQNYLLPAPPAGAGIGIDLENTELQLRTDYRLDAGNTQWTLRPTLAWQNNLRRANEPGNPRSGLFDGDIEIEFDQYVARFEALHEGEGLFDRGTLGFEFRQRDQESRGRTVLSPGGEISSFGVFAYEERQFRLLLVQAGLRYDHIETEGDSGKTTATPSFAGTVGNSYDVVTGALGGSYPLGDHFTLAANAARGFRAPTLFEQFAQGVHGGVAAVQLGNADLDPEESLNLDLSLRWRFDRISGDLTVYQNRIDDYIFLTDTGNQAANGLPIFVHEQADATLQGVEAQVSIDLARDWSLRLVLDFIDTENDNTGEDLPLTPANEVLTELTWQPATFLGLDRPYARASVRYADAKDAAPGEPFQQFDRNPVFGSASTESYWLVNFAAGAFLPGPGERDIRFNIELRNAFDESYRDFLNTYKGYALNPGRDLRLTLEIPFG
jgi:iron complex outermembrane receptor protein/hemoglobin/transferrin/lactoferrin receptor protein